MIGGIVQNLLEKSICKITGTIQNWIENICYDSTHCYSCKRVMAEKELDKAARWPSGDSSVPICDECKEEIIRNFWKRHDYYYGIKRN